jgi:hypothetical protein
MSKNAIWLRRIYALCLVGATLSHIVMLLLFGWRYGGAPLASCVYWTALTLLDPLTGLLLYLRPRTGLVVTIAIIVSDVAHNTWFGLHFGTISTLFANWMYCCQLGFLIFVLLTVRCAWAGVATRPATRSTDQYKVGV